MPVPLQKNISDNVKLLPNQFSDSVKLQNFLSIYLDQVQELEDANIGLSLTNNIYTATGYQLDIIGKLVGSNRLFEESDENYRARLLGLIAVNSSNGTPESVINAAIAVTQATRASYWEHYPASNIVEVQAPFPKNSLESVDNSSPAGVCTGAVMHSETGFVFRGCEENQIIPYDPDETEGYDFCILPELTDIQNQDLDNLCGEPLMACGEPSAECESEYTANPDFRGIFIEAYTKVNEPTFLRACGEPFMLCGEPIAECVASYENEGSFANLFK